MLQNLLYCNDSHIIKIIHTQKLTSWKTGLVSLELESITPEMNHKSNYTLRVANKPLDSMSFIHNKMYSLIKWCLLLAC